MSEPISDERLGEIREREQAATEGPWRTNGSDSPACDVEHAAGFALAYMASGYYRKRGVMEAEQQGVVCQLGTLAADARFMAAARTDVPDLLAEVERLREEAEFQGRMRRAEMARAERAERTATEAANLLEHVQSQREELCTKLRQAEARAAGLQERFDEDQMAAMEGPR